MGARIVANMEASLAVPTATSYREVPAKLLEINRKVINGYLGRTRGGKVSFTHLIGYALVKAIAEHVPAVNNSFVAGPDGEPRIVRHEHVGLGLAVDMEKTDGSRTLIVPVHQGRRHHGLRRVRRPLRRDDPQGQDQQAHGGRLRGGHGHPHQPRHDRHRAVGAPAHARPRGHHRRRAASTTPRASPAPTPRPSPTSGVSKVITLTSTYDHRIIQGAESGLLLKTVDELLLGEDGFYDDIFAALGVPYEAVQWRRDVHGADREDSPAPQADAGVDADQHVPGAGATSSPTSTRWPPSPPEMHSELDPATYGLTIWDLDRSFRTGGDQGIYARVGGPTACRCGDILHVLRDAYCRTVGIEYMHIQEPEEKRWIQEQVEGTSHPRWRTRTSATSWTSSTAPRPSRSSSRPSTWARSASAWRGPSR